MIHTGLDILLHDRLDLLAGRRVGLVSHPAAILPDFTSSLDALRAAGVNLTALFGMEHGFAGSAADGKAIGNATDTRTGLPVFSLYGATKEPTAEMLAGVDVLVYDVQDVGVRFYTFESTLFYLLAASRKHGVPLVVLDRPNPINGLAVEGPSIAPGFESFVGIAPIPIRHGLTVGELARYFNAEHGLGADLTVVPMTGWRRAMWFDQTGLPWATTSPAMPHLSTATVYPGACFIEGTNLSEGRGTALPFEQIGAPWMDAYAAAEALNARAGSWKLEAGSWKLEAGGRSGAGVVFRPTSFEPTSSKYAGETCYGVQMHVTDRDALSPARLGVLIVATLKALYPRQFAWRDYPRADGSRLFTIDRLTGSDATRKLLEAGAPAAEVVAGWAAVEEEFRRRREACLLYE
jgi:uncharacterized protein YbbC (DUF1343 family)